MKIRALDSNGDWMFGQGKGSYLAGVEATIEDIDTALHILLGEAFWAMTFGVDWFNLIGGEAPIAQQNIILQCRQVIISRENVTKINSVNVTFTDYRRSLRVVYDISTVFGRYTSTFIKGFNNAN